MKNNATKATIAILSLLIIAAGYWAVTQLNQTQSPSSEKLSVKKMADQLPDLDELGKVQSKKARNDYFFRMLRDPATNSIPKNIRSREINHAKAMPSILQMKRRMKAKNPSIQVAEGFEWRLAGPRAVGGRTRALGIDQRNPDIIIAGGVSGGIWKSTNGGDTWTLKTPDVENFGVTSLAQDPTSPDTWYYASGEFTSNSAGAPGASYYGTGIYLSTDNGENWSLIPGTGDGDTQFNSPFDFVNRIIVSPVTGTVFIASNGLGIFRAPDGTNFGTDNDPALGGFGEHFFADVTVAADGTLWGVLSSVDAGVEGGNPGVFVSTDDGEQWDEVTPDSFPLAFGRSVLTTAPSNPDIAYVMTLKNSDDTNQGVSFYRLNLSGSPEEAQDRAANLPDFGDPVGGLNLQGGYNMTVSVKPDDPNVVTLGGTNLFRSTDGFATAPANDTDAEKNKFWIGGYAKVNNVSQYPRQHADQHVQLYDPTNPDRLWVGHDGGLSVTGDITANSVSWADKNDGYIVTQFYDVSIALSSNDDRLMGGSQDNGTPLFEFQDGQNIGNISADISSGDGGFSFFTENYLYVSNQQGGSGNSRVIRFEDTSDGDFAIVQPSASETAFFINPYAVDPNDEGIMYYPGGTSLFRNTETDEITNQDGDGTTEGWEELTAAELPNHNISALAVSTAPADILYYAGSNASDLPVILRLDNASTSNDAPVDISLPDTTRGAFVHDIAVNPGNGDEVLVVMSNYNITGLYHTTDAGENWQAVEGNLTGVNDPTSPNPGPSLRSATIIPATSGTIYFLGTSTGVYATQTVQGQELDNNTEWGRESAFDGGDADIGFSIVENITSRISDGNVAVGSHGRGIFLGRFEGEVADITIPRISLENPGNPNESDAGRAGDEITISATNFDFSSEPAENEVLFGDVEAEVLEASPPQLMVEVPRATLTPTSEDRIVSVSVTNNNGADPRALDFTILPPNENALDQNFPNPFTLGNNGTSIPISLQENSDVTLVIYDITGRRIDRPLKDDPYQAGTYNIPVDFSGKASGIYIYRIIAEPVRQNADTFVDSKKFTFIK
jgi:hypothetical protein